MFYISVVLRNIRRHGFKSMLTIFLCVLMVLFLFIYMGNISAIQEQLSRLPDALPVSAQVSTYCGSQVVGLLIDGVIIDQLNDSDTIKDFLYTTRLIAMIVPDTQVEEAGYETIMITGANDPAALPFLSEEDIRLTDGNVQDFFHERKAGVIVEEAYLRESNLKPGDTVTLDLYYMDIGDSRISIQYNEISVIDVLIVGSFTPSEATGSAEMPIMICSAGWAEELLAAYGLPFYADSASFFVRDPFQLNDFKAEMNQLGFRSVSPQAPPSISGIGLSVNDKTFISSAGALQRNLILMQTFLPFILMLVILVGYIASYLMTQGRRPEAAVMRSAGVSKKMCVTVFSVENAVLALSGCLGGVLAAILLTDIGLVESIVVPAAFLAGYMVGSVIAITMLNRFSVMEVLTKVE